MTGLIHEPLTTPGERRSLKEKLYDEEVLARVKKGIALLEAEHGSDWVDHIDLAALNLASGDSCVLGQVYADAAQAACDGDDGYEHGSDVLGIVDEQSDYGFTILGSGERWSVLQQCWEDELAPLVGKTR